MIDLIQESSEGRGLTVPKTVSACADYKDGFVAFLKCSSQMECSLLIVTLFNF